MTFSRDHSLHCKQYNHGDFIHSISQLFIFSIVAVSCNDGIKNANETDVDCGGWCAPQTKCADTMSCVNFSDCMSGVCTTNICQG